MWNSALPKLECIATFGGKIPSFLCEVVLGSFGLLLSLHCAQPFIYKQSISIVPFSSSLCCKMFGLTNQVMGLYTITVCWSHSYSLLFLAVFHRGLPAGHTLLQDSRDSWTSDQAFGSFQVRAMLADCLRHVSSTQSHASLQRRFNPKTANHQRPSKGIMCDQCVISDLEQRYNRDLVPTSGYIPAFHCST